MIRIPGTILAGLLGLAFGSFLNVCLSRWPAGESVVKPRSHCRRCGRTLTWWENVPLVSWLALRGRCRTCKAGISWRYPVVEGAVGTLWGIIAWHAIGHLTGIIARAEPMPISFSPRFVLLATLTVVAKLTFAWALVGLAALDAEELWIPDVVTVPGIAIGLVITLWRGAPLSMHENSKGPFLSNALYTALAIVVASGVILFIRWIYWLVRRREGIGLGDAKLMAMIGAWLGLSGALLSFAIGVVLGALFALIMLAVPGGRRKPETWLSAQLPLGTFLCIGGIVSELWGQPIIAAYLRWAGL